MDHQLENLGPERFQQMCQALLVKEYPGIVFFPVGQPDGGRDAMRHLPNGDEIRFTVFQVKFSRYPINDNEARAWVREVADGEIQKVKRLIERGAKEYVLITNVPGTAHLDSGSIDKTQNELSETLGLPVSCWWRDDINRRLDGSWDIKLRYPEVLSGQDFLRLLLSSVLGQDKERRLKALKAFLVDQYSEDVEVKFKQIELHNKLLDLFVDLPFELNVRARYDKIERFALSLRSGIRVFQSESPEIFVISDSHEDREDHGTATLLLSEPAENLIDQLVVEGAPGQGKSTLAQYICQIHRIRLLNKIDDLEKVPAHHRHAPIRIPFKVDLRDFATWLEGGDPFLSPDQSSQLPDLRSMETFLAHLVRHHCGGIDFNVNDLLELARVAPFLVVLDGLDEVADIRRRAEVVLAVSKAIPRIRENCQGLRIIVTSRPAAFANSPGFDTGQFAYLQLGSVRRSQMQRYADRWMDVRGLARKDRAEFQAILDEKMGEPHLRDLARNPMQLAILLSLIHTRGAALPDKRTGLYDAYVDLFFSREAAKSTVVRQHIDLLRDIHRYLAWVLHSNAETSKGIRSGGRISSSDLISILEKYLKKEKHSAIVIEDIFKAMLERVVMIVSRMEGTHEFEVQPLREYFAARYLYDTASYSPPGKEKSGTKPDRFDAIARNFYWLNVVRFFGGCFSKGELLDLADRVKELIADQDLRGSRHPVSLGAMLLADWVFAQSPKAGSEIVSVLTQRESLRRLMPSSARYRGGQVIQIPARCGGTEILNKAFEYLIDRQTRLDWQIRIAEFVKANGLRKDIDEHWMTSHRAFVGDTAKWLKIGRELGSLARAERDAVTKIIGEGAQGRKVIGELYAAERCDCLKVNEENSNGLLSYMLAIIYLTKYAAGAMLRGIGEPHGCRPSKPHLSGRREGPRVLGSLPLAGWPDLPALRLV